MRADTITGYTRPANLLCPRCVIEAGITAGWLSPGARGMACEDALDQAAHYVGIEDRYDDTGYDSGHFPKVVFAHQVTDTDRCDHCHQPLI